MKASELIRALEKAITEHGDLPVALVTLLGNTRIDRAVSSVDRHDGFLSSVKSRYPEHAPHLVLHK